MEAGRQDVKPYTGYLKPDWLTKMATVYIPSLMQSLTNGRQTVVVAGSTVREVVNNLEEEYPGIKDRLVEKFRIKPNISVAVDGEVTPIGILEKVGEDSEVHFLPAIGGGSAPKWYEFLRAPLRPCRTRCCPSLGSAVCGKSNWTL